MRTTDKNKISGQQIGSRCHTAVVATVPVVPGVAFVGPRGGPPEPFFFPYYCYIF